MLCYYAVAVSQWNIQLPNPTIKLQHYKLKYLIAKDGLSLVDDKTELI